MAGGDDADMADALATRTSARASRIEWFNWIVCSFLISLMSDFLRSSWRCNGTYSRVPMIEAFKMHAGTRTHPYTELCVKDGARP